MDNPSASPSLGKWILDIALQTAAGKSSLEKNLFIHCTAPSGQGKVLEFLIIKSLNSWVQVSIGSDENILKLITVIIAQFGE